MMRAWSLTPRGQFFFGRVAGIEDSISFHADNVEGVVAGFEEAADDYPATCQRTGKSPDRRFSGNNQ
jgi:predicted HicB family RNase H-like nuclease